MGEIAPDKPKPISVDEAIEWIGFGKFQIFLIIICGIIQASDSVEMMLLSVLGPAISCDWMLSNQQMAFITTGVFIGMLIGSPIWGKLADLFGRWGILTITTFIIIYYGLLSSATKSYVWMVILRGMVGFGVGGLSASVSSLFSEFMPKGMRARAMTLMSLSWSLGNLLMAGLAFLILPTLGWRVLVAIAAVPLLTASFSFWWLPRSPRYLAISGEPDKALKVINQIATCNGKSELKCDLRTNSSERGKFKDLFHRRYLRLTLLQWVLWFGSGFSYYGIVLVSTELAQTVHPCLQNWKTFSRIHTKGQTLDISCCNVLTRDSYVAIVFSSLGEFLALPLSFFLLDWWGRKPTLMFNAAGATLMFITLNFCLPSYGADFLLLFTRTFCQAGFTANYVYTTEAYPTSIRVLGMGCCSAVARVGAMLSPFVAQVILPRYSVLYATLIYSGVAFLMLLSASFLPKETKGKSLPQTVSDSSDGENFVKKGHKDKGHNYDTFKDK